MNKLWDNPYPPSWKTAQFVYPRHLMAWYHAAVRPITFAYTDRASWEARSSTIRGKVLDSLGSGTWPVKLPLDTQVGDPLRKEGYVIRRVAYQVWPGVYSTGYLYLPEPLPATAPAILCPHGHWNDAAVDPVVQSRCIGLARKNYIALTVDAVHSADALAGMVDIGVMTWNNIRAIDVLATMPEVDAANLGCTGASGGSLQTQFLMAAEPRLKAVVPVCNVSFSKYVVYPSDEAYCGCNFVPALLQYSDYPEVCALFAPRPALYICATGDWTRPFPKDGFPEIRDVYALYDAQDQVSCIQFDCEHAYHKGMRERAYAFFNRHLRGIDDPAEAAEPDISTMDPRELRERLPVPGRCCTFLGDPDRSRTLLSTYLRGLVKPPSVPGSVEEARVFTGSLRARLADTLHETFSGVRSQCVGRETALGCSILELSLESEADLWIPATLFLPSHHRESAHPAVILTCPEGRRYFLGRERHRVWQLVMQGFAVMLVDIRLMGEMGGVDWNQNQQVMGRWEMGMGARDLRAAVHYLRNRSDVDGSHLCCLASGEAGLAGMTAAALGADLFALALDDMGATFRSGRKDPAVFNLLACGDLPELVSAAVPTHLFINAAATAPYELTRTVYDLLGAPGRVQTLSTAAFLAFDEGLRWIVGKVTEDVRSLNVAACASMEKLVLENVGDHAVAAPIAIRLPCEDVLPAFGVLKAASAANGDLPFARTPAGLEFSVRIPARSVIEYTLVPGDRVDEWPGDACRITTHVWPEGFTIDLDSGRLRIGSARSDPARPLDPQELSVTWLNFAQLRRSANGVFGRLVYQNIDGPMSLLLTVTACRGHIVDLDIAVMDREAQADADLRLVYWFLPAEPTEEISCGARGSPEPRVVLHGQPAYDVDWVRCRGKTASVCLVHGDLATARSRTRPSREGGVLTVDGTGVRLAIPMAAPAADTVVEACESPAHDAAWHHRLRISGAGQAPGGIVLEHDLEIRDDAVVVTIGREDMIATASAHARTGQD